MRGEKNWVWCLACFNTKKYKCYTPKESCPKEIIEWARLNFGLGGNVMVLQAIIAYIKLKSIN